MKKNNVAGEYELLVHSIDGAVSVYRLDRRKFRLFTLGRKGNPARHLSVQLHPDDSSEKGHWLSSMQCYFAWDREKNEWVAGNGQPPDIYIPGSAKRYFREVSSGPHADTNITHFFRNDTRGIDAQDKTRYFKPLKEPEICRDLLAVAFVSAECEPKYQGDIVSSVEGWTEEVAGQVSFAYLIEVVPMKQNRNGKRE